MVLRGVGFGRWCDGKSAIGVLITRPQRAPSPLPPNEDMARRWQLAIWARVLLRHGMFWILDLELPASRTVSDKSLLLISHLVRLEYHQEPGLTERTCLQVVTA